MLKHQINSLESDYTISFAKYYDLMNSEKQYENESIELDSIIRKFIKSKKPKLADIGCGTGNYTIEFSNLGYQVVGFDVSAPMINIAKTSIQIFFFSIDRLEVKISNLMLLFHCLMW